MLKFAEILATMSSTVGKIVLEPAEKPADEGARRASTSREQTSPSQSTTFAFTRLSGANGGERRVVEDDVAVEGSSSSSLYKLQPAFR